MYIYIIIQYTKYEIKKIRINKNNKKKIKKKIYIKINFVIRNQKFSINIFFFILILIFITITSLLGYLQYIKYTNLISHMKIQGNYSIKYDNYYSCSIELINQFTNI